MKYAKQFYLHCFTINEFYLLKLYALVVTLQVRSDICVTDICKKKFTLYAAKQKNCMTFMIKATVKILNCNDTSSTTSSVMTIAFIFVLLSNQIFQYSFYFCYILGRKPILLPCRFRNLVPTEQSPSGKSQTFVQKSIAQYLNRL